MQCASTQVVTLAVPGGRIVLGMFHILICPQCHKLREPYSRRDRQGLWCRECRAAYMRAHGPRYSELSEAERRKHIIRVIARVAKRRGRIRQEPCVVCNSPHSQMHHPDYGNARKVIWLCAKHHRELHRDIKKRRST